MPPSRQSVVGASQSTSCWHQWYPVFLLHLSDVCEKFTWVTDYSLAMDYVSPPLIQCRRFSRPLWKICPLLRAFLVYWFVGLCIKLREQLYTVFRKKHPLTFSFVSPWMMCRFKQKLQWIYVRKVVSENLEIRYSLRPMTSLWRHICLAKVGGSLQHTISHESRISFFASTWYLIGA